MICDKAAGVPGALSQERIRLAKGLATRRDIRAGYGEPYEGVYPTGIV